MSQLGQGAENCHCLLSPTPKKTKQSGFLQCEPAKAKSRTTFTREKCPVVLCKAFRGKIKPIVRTPWIPLERSEEPTDKCVSLIRKGLASPFCPRSTAEASPRGLAEDGSALAVKGLCAAGAVLVFPLPGEIPGNVCLWELSACGVHVTSLSNTSFSS